MTEKKKYTPNFDGAIRINNKELVAYANSEINAQYLCKLLNEQDERIKALEEENEQLKQELKSKELNKKILKESLDW